MKFKSYQCSHNDRSGVNGELAEQLRAGAHMEFPEAYRDGRAMARLSAAIKEWEHESFCVLPFCHTVEGEAFGGQVNYGDAGSFPRPANRRICKTAEDVLGLPDMDFSAGRIREVLEAGRILTEQGEKAVLNMNGPLTILNVLMETSDVFSFLMRGRPEEQEQVFAKIRGNLLRYLAEAAEAGFVVVSYADAMGAADIVGPKMAAKLAGQFTLPFLRDAGVLLSGPRPAVRETETVLFLCPKTAHGLEVEQGEGTCGGQRAVWEEFDVSEDASAAESFRRAARGQRRILGGACFTQLLKTGRLKQLYHLQFLE